MTAVSAFVGVCLAGMATRNGATHSARWAARANFAPVLVYAAYMAAHMPGTEHTQTVQVTVVETGVLADQMVFDKKTRSSGPIQGIRMTAKPCGQEFVVRVTGRPNSHLAVYVPTEKTRLCLGQIKAGAPLDMVITTAESVVFGDAKDFRIDSLGDCTFDPSENGAVVKGLACPEWRSGS